MCEYRSCIESVRGVDKLIRVIDGAARWGVVIKEWSDFEEISRSRKASGSAAERVRWKLSESGRGSLVCARDGNACCSKRIYKKLEWVGGERGGILICVCF